MLYQKVECPICGNEVTAKSVEEPQKCCWCRRLFTAKFTKRKGKKWICEVEPADFPEKKEKVQEKKQRKNFKRSYDGWRDNDVYGKGKH